MSDNAHLLPSRELGCIKVNTVYKIFQSVGANLWRYDIGAHAQKDISD